MLKAILLVGVGGFFGSIARYGVKLLTDKWFPLEKLPHATFIVNVFGCFIIGLLFGLLQRNHIDNSTWLIAATGFCGAFTTFSTFVLENNLMLNDKMSLTAFVYALLSIVVGLILCRVGIWIAG